MAPRSSTLAWKIPWTEEPGGLQAMGSLESDTTEQLHFHFQHHNNGVNSGSLGLPKYGKMLQEPREHSGDGAGPE